MQITLQKLKEIAKAGYEGELPGKGLNVNQSVDYEYRNVYTLLDYSGAIILKLVVGFKHVSIPVLFTSNFNHLAAIRKMEELGLIEK